MTVATRMYTVGVGVGEWDQMDEPDKKTAPRPSYDARRLAIAVLTTDHESYAKLFPGLDEDQRIKWATRLQRMPLGEFMEGVALSWTAPDGQRRFLSITQVGQKLRDIGTIPEPNGEVRRERSRRQVTFPKLTFEADKREREVRHERAAARLPRETDAQRIAAAMAGASKKASK